MPTSADRRLNATIMLSDKVYEAIDQDAHGETRARSIVRLGLAIVARELENSYGDGLLAGDYVHTLLAEQLRDAGVTKANFTAWPRYQATIDALPRPPLPVIDDIELDRIASEYADVVRVTRDYNDESELDARHVVHLMAVALPYAAEYYPDLDQSKLAIYCLVHDIIEVYAGDVNTLGASDEQLRAKDESELAALVRLTSELRERYPRFIQMIHDYEHLVDDEAKFVKTFDKLDPGFTHFYNKGSVLTEHIGLRSEQEFYENVGKITARMQAYAANFPRLLADRDILTRRVAAITSWPDEKTTRPKKKDE